MKKTVFIITFFVSNILFCQNNFKKVLAETTSKHNYSKFDSVAKVLGYKGGESFKVITQFSVDSKGDIINIKARGPHKVFEDEAIRLINELPKMNPTKNLAKGKSMRFTLPLTMVIETDTEKKKRKRKEERKKKKLRKIKN